MAADQEGPGSAFDRQLKIAPFSLDGRPEAADGAVGVSFIVPAFQAVETLRASIESIRAAAPVGAEVIIVDDGSTDETPALAEELGDVVLRRPCQGGAARSRNDAARVARGGILFFVDSDVTVTPSAVEGALRRLEEGADAVFGAYTPLPPPEVRNVATTYKNLVHHYTHQQGAGEATTFWSGFGAVRRSAFLAVEGFDPAVTTSADVEDIHLGYRLVAAGFRIVLDPRLQVQHHKRYTIRGVISSDVFHRAVPWTRAMLHLRTFSSDLNLRRHAMLASAVSLGLPAVLASTAWFGLPALAVAVGLLTLWIGFHWDLLRYARKAWSLRGALATAGMTYLYYLYGVAGAVLGVGAYVLRHDHQPVLNRLHLEPGRGVRPPVAVSVAVVAPHPDQVAAFSGLPDSEPWWELIVVAPWRPPELPPGARFIQVPDGATRHDMRQAALEACQGEMFATLDELSIPDPGWLERVRRAADSPVLAVAGPFHHDRRGLLARANQVVRYWQWRPERQHSWVVDHPAANAAFRADVARLLGGFKVEGALILRLAAFGARPVRFDPEMGVRLTGTPELWQFLHGVGGVARLRASASARYFDIGLLHRLALVAASPIAGLATLLVIVRQAVRERTADATFWFALPLIVAGLASHWFGRNLGLLRPQRRGGLLPQRVDDLAELESDLPVLQVQ